MAAIDIGAAAIDRAFVLLTDKTYVLLNNSANATGTLDTFETWFSANGSNVKIGTFSGSGTSYDDRDYETIGNVTAGSKQTFTGLNCDVVTGDFIGIYHTATTGGPDNSNTGGSGSYYIAGDVFGTGAQTYTLGDADSVSSLYGTGTSPTDWTKSLSDTVSISDSAGKAPQMARSDAVSIVDTPAKFASLAKGDAITASDIFARQVDFSRSLTDTSSIADSLAKLVSIAKSDTVTAGDSFSRIVDFLRTYLDAVSISDTASKSAVLSKADSVSILDDFFKVMTIALSDGVSLVDAIAKLAELSKSDSILATDDFSRSSEYFRTLSDASSVADSLAKLVVLSKADLVSVLDAISKSVVLSKEDSVSVNDSFSRMVEFFRTASDAVTVNDIISVQVIVGAAGRIVYIVNKNTQNGKSMKIYRSN